MGQANVSFRSDDLNKLCDMGFDSIQAKNALNNCNGDLDSAIHLLISATEGQSPSNSPVGTNHGQVLTNRFASANWNRKEKKGRRKRGRKNNNTKDDYSSGLGDNGGNGKAAVGSTSFDSVPFYSSGHGDNGGHGNVAVRSTAFDSVPFFRMIEAGNSTSQYSVDNGQSACTCMALTAARRIVKHNQIETTADIITSSVDEKLREGKTNTASMLDVITPMLLQDIVYEGVLAYNEVVTLVGSSTEHLSAESVLQSGYFDDLELVGDIKQGILTADGPADCSDHPQGLFALLTECVQSTTQAALADRDPSCPSPSCATSFSSIYTCVIMTKTPETILLCLPNVPLSSLPYWIIDTHPRPQAPFNSTSSYALQCNSLQQLVACCHALFPVTQLGPDIPELLAVMYNSFDLYTVQRNGCDKKQSLLM